MSLGISGLLKLWEANLEEDKQQKIWKIDIVATSKQNQMDQVFVGQNCSLFNPIMQ